jgi:hypothetical protein
MSIVIKFVKISEIIQIDGVIGCVDGLKSLSDSFVKTGFERRFIQEIQDKNMFFKHLILPLQKLNVTLFYSITPLSIAAKSVVSETNVAFWRQLHSFVCARHGRERMGVKFPVCIPVL